MPKRSPRSRLAPLVAGRSGGPRGLARYLREVFVEKTLQDLAAAFMAIGEVDMARVLAEEARVFLDVADRLDQGQPVLDPPTKKGARR